MFNHLITKIHFFLSSTTCFPFQGYQKKKRSSHYIGQEEKGQQRTRWLGGITNSMWHEFEQSPGGSKGQGNLVCCSPWGHKELDIYIYIYQGFPGGAVVKSLPADAGDTRDTGLIPGLGRSPGEGSGNPLQYSCLEHSMKRRAWQAMVLRVTKSWTQLKQLSVHTHTHTHTYICCMHQWYITYSKYAFCLSQRGMC